MSSAEHQAAFAAPLKDSIALPLVFRPITAIDSLPPITPYEALRKTITQKGAPVAANVRHARRTLLPALVTAIVLSLFWELAARLNWIDSQFFPAPSEIASVGFKMALTGELLDHIFASLTRTLVAFLIAVATAIPAGLLLAGRYPRVLQASAGLLAILGQINAFSLFPLFVLFFGTGELAKFCILYWACAWPIFSCTITGVKRVDPLLIKGAQALGCNKGLLLREVLFPASLPAIFSGTRIGANVSFLMLAAAEMIGASTGLGWLIQNASVNYFIPRLYVAALTIAGLGVLIEYGIKQLEGFAIHWKQELPPV